MEFKKITLFFISVSLLSACNINEDMRAKSANKEDSYARTIAASNGCMGCHSVANKVVGPAWKKVAEHYKNSPDAKKLLVEKIKNGGKGNWNHETGGATMPAFDKKMTNEDITVVVDYILAL